MKSTIAISLLASLTLVADDDDWVHQKVDYTIGDTDFRGHLIYDEDAADEDGPLPAIFMVPNWMGPDTEATLTKAKEIADDEFAVFVADMYGTAVRPANSSEAGEAAGFVRADRDLMRARAAKGVEVFSGLDDQHPIDSDRMMGIGFCFGGGTLLEYARGGSDALKGIVSFHGDLTSPTLEKDADQVVTPLLVLHGADDPYVPQEDVQVFIKAMQAGEVADWTFVQFSGAVHSFTDPTADSDGARYHERTAERAFEMMEDFAEEWLELDD